MRRLDHYSAANEGPGRDDEDGPFERIAAYTEPLHRLGEDIIIGPIIASIREAIRFLQAQYANIKAVTGITEEERKALIDEHAQLYRQFLQDIGYHLFKDDELPFLNTLDPLFDLIERHPEKPMTIRDAIALTVAGSW